MSEKKGLLPIVSLDLIDGIEQGLKEEKPTDYIASFLERLEVDNPNIARLIIAGAKLSGDKPITLYTAILVYHALESQAQSDRLNAYFISDSTQPGNGQNQEY